MLIALLPAPNPRTAARCASPVVRAAAPILVCLASLVTAACPGLSAEAGLVRLREGEPFSAELLGISPQGEVRFRTGDDDRQIRAAELVAWGEFRDSDRGPQILLADGSWLIAEILQIEDDQLQIYSDLWGEAAIPLAAVRGVLFSPSPAPAVRDAVRGRIMAAEGGEDRLLLENGDVVAGAVREIARVDTGGNRFATMLSIATQGRTLQLPLERVTALIFNPALTAPSARRAACMLLGLSDGSRLYVERVESTAPLLQVALVCRVRLQTDPGWLWPEVVSLQPLGMGVAYLSDFEAIGYKHIPLLQQTRAFGRDRNLRGGQLRTGGCLFAKGISLPTASRVACALEGKYRQFAAEVALDDLGGPAGSVVFRVLLDDGSGGWRTAFESPPVRWGDAPRHVSVELGGAQTLVLIADMGERADVGDHAVWLDARLIE